MSWAGTPVIARHALRRVLAHRFGKLLELLGSGGDELLVVQMVAKDYVRQSVEQGHVRARPQRQPMIRKPRQSDPPWIDDDHSRTPLQHGVLDPHADDRMGLGRVAADQQEHVGLLDFVQRVRGGAAAEYRGKTRHRRAMANAGAIVHVVRSHHRPHELLENVILFVACRGSTRYPDRVGAVLLLDGRQPFGHQPERFVPRRLAKPGKSRAAGRDP